jgi:hypothetical protein
VTEEQDERVVAFRFLMLVQSQGIELEELLKTI